MAAVVEEAAREAGQRGRAESAVSPVLLMLSVLVLPGRITATCGCIPPSSSPSFLLSSPPTSSSTTKLGKGLSGPDILSCTSSLPSSSSSSSSPSEAPLLVQEDVGDEDEETAFKDVCRGAFMATRPSKPPPPFSSSPLSSSSSSSPLSSSKTGGRLP